MQPNSGECPALRPNERKTFADSASLSDEEVRIVTSRLVNGDAIYREIMNASGAKGCEETSPPGTDNPAADSSPPAKSGTSAGNAGQFAHDLKTVIKEMQKAEAYHASMIKYCANQRREYELVLVRLEQANLSRADISSVSQTCPPTESETSTSNVGHAASTDQVVSSTPPAEVGTFASNVGHETPPAQEHEPSPTADDLAPRLDHEKKSIALRALLRGASNTAAAKEAGVDRRTVFRWRQEAEFQAELHRMQNSFCRAQRAWAAELADESVEVINEAIGQGRVAPALELVQALKILGSTSLAEIDGLDTTGTEPANIFPAPIPAGAMQPHAAQPTMENASHTVESTPHVVFVSAASDTVNPQIPAAPLDLEELPYQQQLAIVKLISGKCVAEAAKELNVSIFTIERWMRSDEAFRQVLRRCRLEQAQRLQCKLQKTSTNALALLKCALKHNRNVRVAFAVLRGLKLVG